MFVFGKKDYGRRVGSVLVLLFGVGTLFFYNWITEAVPLAHVMPDMKRGDIGALLEGQMPTDEGLVYLSEQTGLGAIAIEHLWEQGEQELLLRIQEIYFTPVAIEAIKTTPITISEWLVTQTDGGISGMPLVDIRDGDILITKNSRFLGWRNGHAGLVVDAEKGLVLEALMLGSDSQLCDIHKWESYPSFMVLRLKEGALKTDGIVTRSESSGWAEVSTEVSVSRTEELAMRVAEYAEEYLVGIEYHLLTELDHRTKVSRSAKVTSGAQGICLAEPVLQELAAPTGTHCAHLVWYAYMQAGIDLDSDGGFFVTPNDILHSPYLEVVQEYGYGGLEAVRKCEWGMETEEP